jgi:hypothetical protein
MAITARNINVISRNLATSSWAENAITSSFAVTSSYAVRAETSYFGVYSSPSSSISLTVSEAGKYFRTTSATAVSITVPPQSSVSWAANTEIIFEQAGAGQITFVTGSGVVINSSETLKSDKQYSVVALKRTSQDVWTLLGERQLG